MPNKDYINLDYHAFGMEMPGRKWTSAGYRYGFNGKEKDREVNSGSSNFGMRTYDERIGRFFSRDPLSVLAPNKSPYTFAANNPILFIDKNGAFVISPKTAANYPKLNQMLLKIDEMVNDVNAQYNPILRNLARAAGLDIDTESGLQDLRTTLSYGSGPTLIVGQKLYSRNGEVDGKTLNITISGLLVNDVETNSYTRIWNIGSIWFKGDKVGADYGLAASSILVLFNTILHEAGHHMSRKYGGGSALDNAPVPGGDNMDRNFEATTWGRRIGGALDVWSGSSRVVFPDNSARARTVMPIGLLTPSNIRNYFYPKGWQNNTLKPDYLPQKQLGPNPLGTNSPEQPEVKFSGIQNGPVTIPEVKGTSTDIEVKTRID